MCVVKYSDKLTKQKQNRKIPPLTTTSSSSTSTATRNKWRFKTSRGNIVKVPKTRASEKGGQTNIRLMITGVLSYLSKQLTIAAASRTTGDKTHQQLQLSLRDLTSMLNSLEALAGKLSPLSANIASSNTGNNSSGQSANSSSGLDTNANRVHPYLKQGSTSNNNNNSSSQSRWVLNIFLLSDAGWNLWVKSERRSQSIFHYVVYERR